MEDNVYNDWRVFYLVHLYGRADLEALAVQVVQVVMKNPVAQVDHVNQSCPGHQLNQLRLIHPGRQLLQVLQAVLLDLYRHNA